MRTKVGTTEGGQGVSMPPDVCYLPAPPQPPAGPGGIPTPYPNKGEISDAKKVTKKVFIRNKPVTVAGSYVPSSSGDDAGCSQGPLPGKLGLKSRKQGDKVEFTQESSTVKFEGKGVICQGASTKHNDGNTIGKFMKPSQSDVLADM